MELDVPQGINPLYKLIFPWLNQGSNYINESIQSISICRKGKISYTRSRVDQALARVI